MAPVPVTFTFPSLESAQRMVDAFCWLGGLGPTEQPASGTRADYAKKVLINYMNQVVDRYESSVRTPIELSIT